LLKNPFTFWLTPEVPAVLVAVLPPGELHVILTAAPRLYVVLQSFVCTCVCVCVCVCVCTHTALILLARQFF